MIDEINISAVWYSTNARFSNISGTPIVSVAESNSGELIADEYQLTFSAVAGGTATITVSTATPNNPYSGRVVTGVVCDGATIIKNVVPGLALVLSGGVANTNVGKAFGGLYLGVFDAEGVGAGTPSAGVRHRVTNDGSGPVSAAKARLLKQAIAVKKTGTVFDYIRPFADNATEKTVGGGSDRTMPYAIKVIAVSGAGSAKIGTVQVDGVTLGAASLLDITTGASVSGTGIKAVNPGYGYRVLTGPLEGLEFALSSSVATDDIANVLIFPSRFIQIAPDVAGSEGNNGPDDVDLTEVGQSTGIIQPAAVAYYWSRVLVPISGVAESNPHPGFISLEGSTTESAGWGV